MKKFSIPVTWQVWDKVEVEVETIEEAIKYVPSNILIDRMVNRGDKIDKIQQRIKNMRKNDELKNGLFCNFAFTPTNPGIYDPKICVEEFYQFIKRNF